MLDLISKSDVLNPDVFDDSNPERARVQSILDVVLGHVSDDEKILYHFGECDGHDDEHYEFVMKDQLAPWHTIYDSCYFPVTDAGSYSVIQVAYSKCGKHFYLSPHTSALTPGCADLDLLQMPPVALCEFRPGLHRGSPMC